MRAFVALVLVASCDQVLSLPSTIEDACTADIECSVDRPRCEVVSGVCRECLLPEHCPTAKCRPNHACVREEEVLFADVMGQGEQCTRAERCAFEVALESTTAEKNVIELGPGDYAPTATTIQQPVSLFAVATIIGFVVINGDIDVEPGGGLTVVAISINGQIRCNGGAVAVVDVAIGGGTSGIAATDCDVSTRSLRVANTSGIGIVAIGGSLVFDRSLVEGSQGGGIQATTARITGSVLRSNGSSLSEFGAADLGAGEIVFSTIFGNSSGPGFGNALRCGSASINSSIVLMNNGGPTFANDCRRVTFTASEMVPDGVGNLTDDPMLLSDSHIGPQSACAGAGDPTLRALDIDGDLRPQPAGTPPDCGADEIP